MRYHSTARKRIEKWNLTTAAVVLDTLPVASLQTTLKLLLHILTDFHPISQTKDMSLEQDPGAVIAHHLEIQSTEITTTTFSILHRYPQIHLQGDIRHCPFFLLTLAPPRE